MTNTTKYSFGAFFLILLFFLYNQNSQRSYQVGSVPIYDAERDKVYRILISEENKEIELIRTDTIWSIKNVDTLIVKENQIDKVFDRLLKVEQEMEMTSRKEKWQKFGVDDSLGRHLQIFDKNDNEILHYIFGNSGQDYQHNYIRKNKSDVVYRTNDNVYFLLNCNTTYWGSKPPEPDEESENIGMPSIEEANN